MARAMLTPRELKRLYAEGRNISALMREERSVERNTREIIEVSYDLQAGSYVEAMQTEEIVRHKEEYSAGIARVIRSLCQPGSVLEAGVGEATTLSGVLRNLGGDVASYGFDLSWSRIACARNWLLDNSAAETVLCTGDLLNIPFRDDSIDVVYTSHSVEPNGGMEEPILQELYRVTRRYLILLEPAYELGSDEARQRMDSHGYCRRLKETSLALGHDVVTHELFPYSVNPLNPTALTVIAKNADGRSDADVLACPRFKTPVKPLAGALFSPEALVAYPVLGGIPCLRIENGVMASLFQDAAPNG